MAFFEFIYTFIYNIRQITDLESEVVMNYYEFLNKQLETPQGQQIGQKKN